MKLLRALTLKKTLAIGGIFLFLFPLVAFAGSHENILNNPCVITDFNKAIKLQFEIPNVTQEQGGNYYIKDLGCYIVGVYRYFAGVAGILTVVMVMYGGVRYVVSLGNQQKISQAKDTITSALVGLLLVLGSYTMLYFINPNLTSFTLDLGAAIPTISDQTRWCTSEDESVEGQGRDCGAQGIIKGTNEACTWPGECQTQGKICAFVGTGNGYECILPELACEELTEGGGSCAIVDAAMAAADVKNKSCTEKTTKTTVSSTSGTVVTSECVYEDLLICGGFDPAYTIYTTSGFLTNPFGDDNDWRRVDCEEGVTPSLAQGCWNSQTNQPYALQSSSGGGREGTRNISSSVSTCTNDTRVAEDSGSLICCIDVLDVDCRDTCNADEKDITGTTKVCSYLDLTFTGKGNACDSNELDAGRRCCLEVDLKSSNGIL